MGSPFVGEGEFFTSAIQLRKCASSTIIQVLQRGAAAEDMGKGLSQEGPIDPGRLQNHPYIVDFVGQEFGLGTVWTVCLHLTPGA